LNVAPLTHGHNLTSNNSASSNTYSPNS